MDLQLMVRNGIGVNSRARSNFVTKLSQLDDCFTAHLQTIFPIGANKKITEFTAKQLP